MQDHERLMPTGIRGLDHLLGGGIVRGNSLLIEGPPGSGKTTFAIRSLYQGVVEYDEPGLILTFEEFPRQIYQEAAAFGMDLGALEKSGKLRVVWTPPERILQGFTGNSDLVDNIIQEMGVRRLVIDSITHFKRVAHSEVELRESLAEILKVLKLKGINAILVKELERMDDATIAFEEYLVDASLRVLNRSAQLGGANERFLEIRKTRGQDHLSGLHPFELGADGVTVYPRLRPEDVTGERPSSRDPRRRVTTGVKGLDRMLSGGLWESSFNLLSGYQGTGKTVLAYHFIEEGLSRGERCRFVSFSREAEDLLTEAAGLGWDWREAHAEGRLVIDLYSRGGMSMEKFLWTLGDRMRANSPERFVLESLDDLFTLPGQHRQVADGIHVLSLMLRRLGAAGLLLHRAASLSGDLSEEMRRIGEVTDCVLQFSLAESEGRLHRFLSVRKHAGSEHEKRLREVEVGAKGMRTLESEGRQSGILTGQLQMATDEASPEVMPRLKNLRKLLRDLGEESVLDLEAREKLQTARRELALADVVLREHFGLTQFRNWAAGPESPKEPEPSV